MWYFFTIVIQDSQKIQSLHGLSILLVFKQSLIAGSSLVSCRFMWCIINEGNVSIGDIIMVNLPVIQLFCNFYSIFREYSSIAQWQDCGEYACSYLIKAVVHLYRDKPKTLNDYNLVICIPESDFEFFTVWGHEKDAGLEIYMSPE